MPVLLEDFTPLLRVGFTDLLGFPAQALPIEPGKKPFESSAGHYVFYEGKAKIRGGSQILQGGVPFLPCGGNCLCARIVILNAPAVVLIPESGSVVFPAHRLSFIGFFLPDTAAAWRKCAQAFFQPLFGKPSVHGTCLHMHAAGRNDQAVAPFAEREAMFGQDVMNLRPGRGPLEIFQAVPADPAGQALQIARALHIGCAGFHGLGVGFMIVGLQAVYALKEFAGLGQFPLVVIGFMHGQLAGMDLVDGDMQMRIIGIVVHDGNPLMLFEAKLLADIVLNFFERGAVRVFLKGQNQMVGFVALGTGVLLLHGQHLQGRPLRRFRIAVGNADLAHARVHALGIGQVADKPQHAAFGWVVESQSPRDHLLSLCYVVYFSR